METSISQKQRRNNQFHEKENLKMFVKISNVFSAITQEDALLKILR